MSKRWLQYWLAENPVDSAGLPFYVPIGRNKRFDVADIGRIKAAIREGERCRLSFHRRKGSTIAAEQLAQLASDAALTCRPDHRRQGHRGAPASDSKPDTGKVISMDPRPSRPCSSCADLPRRRQVHDALEPIGKYLGQTWCGTSPKDDPVDGERPYPNVGQCEPQSAGDRADVGRNQPCRPVELCSCPTVERYREDAKVKDPATLDWVTRFGAAAKPHLGAMVLFIYLTGARPRRGRRPAIGMTSTSSAGRCMIREMKASKKAGRSASRRAILVAARANLPASRCARSSALR